MSERPRGREPRPGETPQPDEDDRDDEEDGEMEATATATSAVTVLTKLPTPNDPHGNLLSKRIYINGSAELVADGAPCRMANGTAKSAPAPNADALASIIAALKPSQALALGSLSHHDDGVVNVVTMRALRQISLAQRSRATIARSREYIDYRAGVAAWLLIDFDLKGAPSSVVGQIATAGGLWRLLCTVTPGLARAARVSRISTSAGVTNTTTGERYLGSGGEHHFLLVKDGADIDRALQALHDRCWLHGHGWYLIGGAGQISERSIVDAMVRFGERLVFEGAPQVEPPLQQDASVRAPQPHSGIAIDTTVIIPPLTEYEQARVAEAKDVARKAIAPQAASVRIAADRTLTEKMVERTGVPFATALRIVEARHRGELLPDMELQFDHLGTITVREVLTEPDKYIGETLADPLEGPEYGFGKAKVLRSNSDPTRIFIHSFAHGRTLYDLKHDLRSAIAAVQRTPKAHAADVMCSVAASVALERDEIAQLIDATAKVAGVGVRAIQARLKADMDRRDLARRQAEDAARRAASHDPRIHRPAPPADHELTPIVTLIDQTLAADTSAEPPMRDADGHIVEVVVRSPFALHQLTQSGANAETLPEGVQLIPAPPEPRIARKTPTEIALLVEQFIAWDVTDKDGIKTHQASLPRPFVDAFMQIGGRTRLPAVHAVNTMPMVLLDGTILDGVGLDRTNGLVHRIEPALRACLPNGEITETDVREAIDWLLNTWLCDVLASTADKLVVILLALTIIQRHLLQERPGFCVTAGTRGTGKTTLIMMVAMAVLGRLPAAATWSTNEEERRKALFTYLLQAIALIVWDNLPRGLSISCPHIAKALTAAAYTDRILGSSQAPEPLATSIHLFTGNGVRPGGDLASRVPVIHLQTDDPDPENRTVTHTDPVGWTEMHRGEILRRLYLIMVYGCRLKTGRKAPQTRFKRWWDLIGRPVEIAAALLKDPEAGLPVSFKCTEIFSANEEEDEESTGVAGALAGLMVEFPPGEQFVASDVVDILKEGRGDGATSVQVERADKLREALESLVSRRRAEMPSARVLGMALKGKLAGRPTYLPGSTTVGVLRCRGFRHTNFFEIKLTSRKSVGPEGPEGPVQPPTAGGNATSASVAPDAVSAHPEFAFPPARSGRTGPSGPSGPTQADSDEAEF